MTTILATLTFLAACKGPSVQTVEPTLQVSPTSATIPLTAFGTPGATSLTLQALTAVDVQCTLALDGGGFSISPSGMVTVPGSGTLPVTVTFAPALPSPIPAAAESYAGALSIASNDPLHPEIDVALKATAQAPYLDVCSSDQCLSDGGVIVDFGSLAPRQMGGPTELDLENRAQVPLTVTGFALDSAALAAGYAIVEAVTTPFTLSAQTGLTEAFHITLDPMVSGTTAAGNLVITSDDPRADGGVDEVALTATVQAAQPPTACLGIKQINYIDGTSAAVNPDEPLSSQPAIVPPGPLDGVVITAIVSAICSNDPQDGQSLAFDFGLADPPGSAAALANVSGHPEEQSVQFDVAGTYVPSVTVTDSVNLSAMAQLDIPVVPQSDLEAQLTWTGGHAVDLDLHLVRQLGDAGTAALVGDPVNDCFWCNCLLASNYSGGSPCGAAFGTQLQWGSVSSTLAGNPLLVANQGYQPLPSEDFDDVRLTGPSTGTTYGLFVHYYQAYAPGDAGLPDTEASLRIFVAGQDLFDGGPPLTQTLREPCDLWHAADVVWLGGGHLPDGGVTAGAFTLVPVTVDGGLGSNGTGTAGLVCGTF